MKKLKNIGLLGLVLIGISSCGLFKGGGGGGHCPAYGSHIEVDQNDITPVTEVTVERV